MAPASRPDATVLFRAPDHPWALIVAIALFLVVFLPVALVFVVMGLTRVHSPVTGVAILGAAALVLLLGLLLIASGRQSFTVTTAGIVLRSYLSTRHLPWPQIRLIRVGPASLRAPRATELVLTDGSTLRPRATSMNFALWRGETPLAHGADGRTPTRSTAAAIDAHRRFLAGEFAGEFGA